MGSQQRAERASSLAEVVGLFETWGRQRYDEEVSQLDHALQTAALARAGDADDELVAAALLHDVGHLLELRDDGVRSGDVYDDLGHEAKGARFLTSLYAPAVIAPIALHVAAKRYRCAVDPPYLDTLSAGSARSLARQGGPMSAAEAEQFASRPGANEAVRLRGWDDGAKVDGLTIDGLNAYLELLDRLVRSRP